MADSHAHLFLSKQRARWININPYDASAWAEVLLPELEGAAFIDTDLKDERALANIRFKVSLVNREIVRPLRHVASRVFVE